MARTEFITSTISNHSYELTIWNRETKQPETALYSTKTKADPETICKLWNKANSNPSLKAVDADWKRYNERKFRIELSKFIEVAEPVENRKNGDYICRNINTQTYTLTIWNRETKQPETDYYSSKTKADPETICKLWNKANSNPSLKAVDVESVTTVEQMYCISIDDMIFFGTEYDLAR